MSWIQRQAPGGRLLAVLAAVVVSSVPAHARPPGTVEYDIVRHHDSLAVWVNLAPYFGEPEFQALAEGVGFACEVTVELTRPRRFFGAEAVAAVSGTLRLSYRLLTESFCLEMPGADSSEGSRTFLTRGDILGYLQDSVVLAITRVAGLPGNKSYRAALRIERIALTSINLAVDDQPGGGSPIRVLFREFLKLTNYGREEWSATSRSFSLDEVLAHR